MHTTCSRAIYCPLHNYGMSSLSADAMPALPTLDEIRAYLDDCEYGGAIEIRNHFRQQINAQETYLINHPERRGKKAYYIASVSEAFFDRMEELRAAPDIYWFKNYSYAALLKGGGDSKKVEYYSITFMLKKHSIDCKLREAIKRGIPLCPNSLSPLDPVPGYV